MTEGDANNVPSVTCRDPSIPEYRVHHDFESRYELSTTLVMALEEIADAEKPLAQALSSVIDPDCLNGLFRPVHHRTDREEGHVRFPIDEYEVTVHATGDIVIRPRTDQ